MNPETPPNKSPPTPGERAPDKKDHPRDKQEILDLVKRRYEEGVSAFEENRRMHSEDLNFVYNSEAMGQWDPVVIEARQGKPCYTFNRVIGPVNLVVADMRQTRPAAKVRPASESASEATAEVYEGMMRSIEEDSRASAIYKTQYKFAVAGGYGAWRLLPEYENDETFNQVLRIKDIPNPQTVIWDPECSDPCAGDAMWCMIAERISKEKYRSLYGEMDEQSFYFSRDSYGWFTDKEVRIVEYMERVPFKKTIAKLSDGRVIEYNSKEGKVEEQLKQGGPGTETAATIVSKREVLKWRVMWVKCDGGQILEGPEYYNWKKIPVVRVPGRYINIEGRKKFQSLIRHAKDAQRSYNSRCSDMIERSALIPKAPYLVTETMVKGYESEWAQANTSARPYLPFNVDPKFPEGGMPQRIAPIDMPTGALALAQAAVQDIQATIGFFDPALGNAEDMNRVSGKALVQHTRRSDLSSFEFIDGYGDALQLTYEMGMDMIPSIYVDEQVVRIVGKDDIEKLVTVNKDDGKGGVIHDLKAGSYSCTVTIGPSFQTARQETLATLIDAAETIPMVAQFAPDLIAKNIDSPDSDELARRLRIPLIHQGIVQPTEEEQKQLPPPPPPDPMKAAETARMQALAQRDGANAQEAIRKAGLGQLETNRLIYDVAGKHLNNQKTAAEMGNQANAAQAEAQAAHLDLLHQAASGQQGLQQDAMEHVQGLQQQQQQNQSDIVQQLHQHVANMRQTSEAHEREMSRTQQKHELELKHTAEKHAQELEHAKALAAAKPKTPSK